MRRAFGHVVLVKTAVSLSPSLPYPRRFACFCAIIRACSRTTAVCSVIAALRVHQRIIPTSSDEYPRWIVRRVELSEDLIFVKMGLDRYSIIPYCDGLS